MNYHRLNSLRRPVCSIALLFVASFAQSQTLYSPAAGIGPSAAGNTNVGVGTSNPGTKLDVLGSIRSTNNTPLPASGTGVELFYQPSPSSGVLQAVDRTLSAHLLLRVGPDSFFTPAGQLGLGTASPAFKLDVVQDGNNSIRASGNSANSVGIYVSNLAPGARQWGLIASGGGPSPAGTFTIWDDVAHSPRFNIDPAGKVGIGTTTPQSNLHLQASAAYQPQVLIENAGGAGAGYLIFQKSKSPQVPIEVGDPLGTILSTAFANGGFQQASYLMFLTDAPTSGSNIFSALTYTTRNVDGSETEKLRSSSNGNVGIGTSNPTQKLSVNGTIRAKEVIVETTGWSDYVLAKDYTLQPLSSVEEQIERDGHLPGIPSAREVAENGIRVGAMQAKLLAKIEELTLHQIRQGKQIAVLQQENSELRKAVGISKSPIAQE